MDELRHGDISEWIAAYDQHGRLVPCRSADEQTRTLVADWYVAAREHGMEQTVMLAGRRDEVADLNHLARATRVAAGELDDASALTVNSRSFAQGDRVLALRNRPVNQADHDGRHLLRNGNRGTVIGIDRQAVELTGQLDSGPTVRLPSDYLADGHVDHGYAMTIHKAQGMTTRQSFVLASPDLARELGYVAASRHTDEAHFYVNVPDPGERPPGEPALEDRDLYSLFERRLGTERAKHLALDETEIDTQLSDLSTAQLLEIQDRGRTLLTSIPNQAQRARDAALIERATSDLARVERLRTNAQAELDQLGRGRRDRQRRDLLENRILQLGGAIDNSRQELADRTDKAASFDLDQWLQQNELEVVEAAAADRELAARRADAYWRATRTVSLDVDPEIERRLGERPDSPSDREEWERAAAAQESYALQYGQLPDPDITDTASLTGRQFDDFKQTIDLAEKFVNLPTPDLDLGPDLGP